MVHVKRTFREMVIKLCPSSMGLFAVLLLLYGVPEITSLKCYCELKECDFIRPSDCPGKGIIIKDPCKCCDVCSKTEGEPCGGPGDFSGTCEPALQCVSKLPVTEPGVCTDIRKLIHYSTSGGSSRERSDSCPESERMELAAGCVIANKRCKCFHKSYHCSNSLHHTWDFPNLLECRLNLKSLLKVEMDFDEDFKVSANLYDPSSCSQVICPKITQCPEGSVEIYSTFTPAIEPIDPEQIQDDKSPERGSNSILPENTTAEEEGAEVKTIVKRSVDTQQGKRSVPEMDDDELNAVSTQPEQAYSTSNAVSSIETDPAPAVTPSPFDQDNSTLIHQCCTQTKCVCDTSACNSPKCDAGLVALVINPNAGRPGSCCPIFECTHLPKCDEEKQGLVTWRENCRSCVCDKNETHCTAHKCLATRNETAAPLHSISDEPTNLDLTQQPQSCLSQKLQRHFMHGSQWIEDDCVSCKCFDGTSTCQIPSCKPLSCSKLVMEEGECCPHCDGFCKGHQYCEQNCVHGFVVDVAMNCSKCECNPRARTTPPRIWVAEETSTQPSISVAEQDETGSRTMVIVSTVAFCFGLAFGCLAGVLYMRKKKRSYSTVPRYDTNANPILYKGA